MQFSVTKLEFHLSKLSTYLVQIKIIKKKNTFLEQKYGFMNRK